MRLGKSYHNLHQCEHLSQRWINKKILHHHLGFGVVKSCLSSCQKRITDWMKPHGLWHQKARNKCSEAKTMCSTLQSCWSELAFVSDAHSNQAQVKESAPLFFLMIIFMCHDIWKIAFPTSRSSIFISPLQIQSVVLSVEPRVWV